ncbi:MAG: hypothetical protein WBQ23_11635 [Bacteroidota bacterium]
MGFLQKLLGDKGEKREANDKEKNKTESLPPGRSSPGWLSDNTMLELLARFFRGADPWTFIGKEHWNDVLGAKVEHVIERLRVDGALVQAPLELTLRHRYSATDLKYLLSDRGLDQAGTQEEMIERLLASDREGVALLTADANVLVLSTEARKAVIQYVKRERERRETAERKSLVGLLQYDYLRAALAAGEYQKNSVFSRGVGLTFNNDDQHENVQLLQKLFEKTPALLDDISRKTLDALRPPAGMAFLWSRETAAEWIPEDLIVDGPWDADTVCSMLRRHAQYLMDLEKYRDDNQNAFKVWSQLDSDSCPACRSFHGEVYSLDTLPELPHVDCKSKRGCRCTVVTFAQAF